MDRDRDSEGRARNARARDGLGRPLPRGAAGVPRQVEGVARSPEQTLTEAQQLFNAGRPFHAHEVFEDAWKSSSDGHAGLWKALAQLAVGVTHQLRENQVGAVSLLQRAAAGFEPYVVDPPFNLNLQQLREWALGAHDRAMPALRCPPSAAVVDADRAAIARIVRTFFAAFTSGPGCIARLDALRAVFLPEAVIIRTGGGEPAVYGVDSFIAPRQILLSGGALVDFSEWELSGHTEVFGDIAQHFCSYAKAGVQDGTPFTAKGMKSLQFVRTSAGWRISAAAWDDERHGLAIESN